MGVGSDFQEFLWTHQAKSEPAVRKRVVEENFLYILFTEIFIDMPLRKNSLDTPARKFSMNLEPAKMHL